MLHRDISTGNVMLGDPEDDEVGLLGDWDHAFETRSEDGSERKSGRTGTWQFMSIALLEDPDKPHELIDDLEALFWTLVYAALHRFRHKSRISTRFFHSYWDEQRNDGVLTGRRIGGDLKREALPDLVCKVTFDCEPLDSLIDDLAIKLNGYYHLKSDVLILKSRMKWNPKEAADIEKRYESARASLEAQQAQLNQPSFWRAYFSEALQRNDWVDDVSEKVIYRPPKDPDMKTQPFGSPGINSSSLGTSEASSISDTDRVEDSISSRNDEDDDSADEEVRRDTSEPNMDKSAASLEVVNPALPTLTPPPCHLDVRNSLSPVSPSENGSRVSPMRVSKRTYHDSTDDVADLSSKRRKPGDIVSPKLFATESTAVPPQLKRIVSTLPIDTAKDSL
ncbi:hypothetical protein BC629DRAFT_1591058 [Irpex lacteus]|nr:hypothetical protein BC629DRAFT_1591058 [Irpex lacteus]